MIWFAIYWLVCFAIIINFQARKGVILHWKVVVLTFLCSPFLPIVMIFMIVKKAIKKSKER